MWQTAFRTRELREPAIYALEAAYSDFQLAIWIEELPFEVLERISSLRRALPHFFDWAPGRRAWLPLPRPKEWPGRPDYRQLVARGFPKPWWTATGRRQIHDAIDLAAHRLCQQSTVLTTMYALRVTVYTEVPSAVAVVGRCSIGFRVGGVWYFLSEPARPPGYRHLRLRRAL